LGGLPPPHQADPSVVYGPRVPSPLRSITTGRPSVPLPNPRLLYNGPLLNDHPCRPQHHHITERYRTSLGPAHANGPSQVHGISPPPTPPGALQRPPELPCSGPLPYEYPRRPRGPRHPRTPPLTATREHPPRKKGPEEGGGYPRPPPTTPLGVEGGVKP